ncbi:cryptochrome/photolyase family protein [Pseudoroseomonas sp. WGS1072]|uniref:cryptochrome/photolyase family protein n=1 Tax=Roseomonas sp. WGS1072 TaxID=3366816 RepID=UPI003BF0CCB4
MSEPLSLLWLRHDLRLADHPALAAAAEGQVLPVYVLDEAAAGRWAPGGAARWWLHHSLAALSAAYRDRGVPLLLLQGEAARLLPRLAEETGAASIAVSAGIAPWARAQEAAVEAALARQGRSLNRHPGATLLPPDRLRTGQGRPYSVYTPFARAALALGEPPPPLPAPDRLRGPARPPKGLALERLGLLPPRREGDWAAAFPEYWTPGEAGAEARLREFLEDGLPDYARGRDRPGEDGSSRLSPHLHWGEISPRRLWHATRGGGAPAGAADTFLREILWRDFNHSLLWHRPEMPEQPLRAAYRDFPYEPDRRLLRAWQRGLTGYPIVDAGMRQLWKHGWMHNRVRMIAGSLLVKHLLQPWWEGEAWFWDTLVDADLANNSANWQWIAGCGSDASPYFRVFNPVLQGEKFDPEGSYVRDFVPELAKLPSRWLHRPWQAPAAVLEQAGLRLGETYPAPVVDHESGRARALAALRSLKAGR